MSSITLYQCFGSALVSMRIQIRFRIQNLMTKNENKLKKSYFFDQNFNLLIPRPPQRTCKLQEKPSARKRERPALQNLTFFHFFLLFDLLDPYLKHCLIRYRTHILLLNQATQFQPYISFGCLLL